MKPLTPIQHRVLDFIAVRCIAGRAPTVQEIADQFGFANASGAHSHVTALKLKRRIEVTPGHRGIRLVGMDDPQLHRVIATYLRQDAVGRDAIASFVDSVGASRKEGGDAA